MTFESRINEIKKWLKDDILPRFTAPANVDKVTAAQDVADAVNANIPKVQTLDQFKSHLDNVARKVIQNARSRTLPVPKDFIEACREATKQAVSNFGPRKDTKLCTYAITEKRVRNGEPIGSTWLTDLAIKDLLANTSLTINDLQPYIAAHKQEKNNE